MATVEGFYVDPSALLKLYLNEPESRAMTTWRAKQAGPLDITLHGRVELTNGISLAAYRGLLPKAVAQAALAALEDDFAQGRLRQIDVHWRSALRRAADLSQLHTASLGTRTLDILHVACALELGLARFVTFDNRQQKLAKVAGLKVVRPAG